MSNKKNEQVHLFILFVLLMNTVALPYVQIQYKGTHYISQCRTLSHKEHQGKRIINPLYFIVNEASDYEKSIHIPQH